jgi:hypothetical protein
MDISRSELQAALEHVVQIALDRNDHLPDLPVVQLNPNPEQAEADLLSTRLPKAGQPLDKTFSQVFENVLKDAPNANGPR